VKAGGSRVDGVTGAGGEIDVEIPAEATSAEVTLWLDKRPTGRTRRYVVKIAALPGADTAPGAQLRLRNLGYFWGKPGELLDASTREALRDFQRDHGLEPSGELDGDTSAKLVEIQGH
jgi:type VI secretion system secreted protein VgrG